MREKEFPALQNRQLWLVRSSLGEIEGDLETAAFSLYSSRQGLNRCIELFFGVAMKSATFILAVLVSTLWLPSGWSSTADTEQVSSSRAHFKSQKLGEFRQQTQPEIEQQGFRYESSASTRRHCQCSYSVSMQDAKVFLSGDADRDGHFYGVKVELNLDLDSAGADVFTRLLISYEGGPWNRLYTSQVFHLEGRNHNDTFVIDTILDSGYPSGIYDLLIEVFDSRSGDWLLSHGPNEDRALRTLPLESITHDRVGGASASGTHLQYGIYGSGSLGWVSLLLLFSAGLKGVSKNRSTFLETP